MNVVEYKERLYNSAIRVVPGKDLKHHGIEGQKWDRRRYQNLDGSLTPLGRIHYGVGMSREEQAAAREAEDRRQNAIDEYRSRSIREMDNDELQDMVNRSRNEMMFEKNMMDRSNNFLQSRNVEERLNMEYEQMQYEQSRLKAERFMGRIERLARFGGNLASAYEKVESMKGKIEERKAKANIAEQEGWKARQQEEKYNQESEKTNKQRWNNEIDMKERMKSLSIKEAKAEKKAAKQAEKEAKKETKKAEDPKYIRKEGDTYIYDEKTKSKWQSIKDKIAAKKEAKAAAKREDLKNQAKGARFDYMKVDNGNLDTYFNGKNNKTSNAFENKTYADREKQLYDTSPTWKRTIDSAKLRREESAKQERIKNNLDTNKFNTWWSERNNKEGGASSLRSSRYSYNPVSNWGNTSNSIWESGKKSDNYSKVGEKGEVMSKAAVDRKKKRGK